MGKTKEASGKNIEGKWVPSSCSGCFNACAILVKAKDGKIVEIKGDPKVASSKGKICGKGKARIADLYNPKRVTKPLKRTNPEKGLGVDPKWVEISWEEAMDTIVRKLGKIRNEDPRKLVISHFDIWNYYIPQAFGQAFGTPNDQYFPNQCGSGLHTVLDLTLGTINSEIDLEYSNYVMLWGSQLGHGVNNNPLENAKHMADARKRGAKLVVVDPICSHAAAKADEWIPIRPGADGALALGMVNVLLNDLEIYDADFLKKRTNAPYLIDNTGHYVRDKQSNEPLVWDSLDGKAKVYDSQDIRDYALEGTYDVSNVQCRPAFIILKEHLKKNYPIDKVSKITTVPAKTIARIAKEFGEAARIGSTITIEGKSLPFRPAALEFKKGISHHKNSFFNCFSLMLLNIIVGNLDVPGGIQGTNAKGLAGLWDISKGKDGLLYTNVFDNLSGGSGSVMTAMSPYPPREASPPTQLNLKELMPLTGYLPGTTSFTISDPEKFRIPYKAEALIICRNNMVVTNNNPKAQDEMLKKLDFILGFAIKIDETMEFADIVLPELHDQERHWLFPSNMPVCFQKPGLGDWYFQITQPAVEPPKGVRGWLDTMIEIADRLGILSEMNNELNKITSLSLVPVLALEPNTRYAVGEITNRQVQLYAALGGKGVTPELFTEKEPVLNLGKKKLEECYPVALSDVKVPIYFEYMIDVGKSVEKVTRELGMNWWDVSYYNPLVEWRPCPAHNEDGKEYDLFVTSSKLPLHWHSKSADNPWIDDISRHCRMDYNILVNTDTATKKGISDGDIINVESRVGKVKGKVRVTECVHPEVVGILGLLGQWSKDQIIAKGKGVLINTLVPFEWDMVETITGQLDTCARVKIYKEREE